VTTPERGDDGADASPTPPPATDVLERLSTDEWSALLPHLRRALHDLEGPAVTPVVERLRASPSSKLVAGRLRRDLARLVSSDGPLWWALRERLSALETAPPWRAALLGDERPPDAPAAPGPSPAGAEQPPAGSGSLARGDAGRVDALTAEVARLRERVRTVRRERDEARRRVAGETARAEGLERDLTAAREALALARADRQAAEAALAAAEQERRRAVDRERRRQDARREELAAQLAELRRAEQARQADERRRTEDQARARDRASRQAAASRSAAEDSPGRLVPGRPSRLPRNVAPGTTEAARLLLHPGRLVLVDGYNVTLQHRPQLDLEGQRTWLIQQLATLVVRRRVRPTVVFDGERAGGARPPTGLRDVAVRFTDEGISADDELVLDVEATDEPVTVVTDDRELTARLRASGADVVGTRSFLGALG
jgi:hypothetical protein